MKALHILCLLIASLVDAEYSSVLFKLTPKTSEHINKLQNCTFTDIAQFINPFSIGKSILAVVAAQNVENFETILKSQGIRYKNAGPTNIRNLSISSVSQALLDYRAMGGQQSYTLESPRITNWGVWGNWANCEPNSYATGMRLKVDPHTSKNDNTALNAIALLCGQKDSHEYKEIHSLEGTNGDWGKTYQCPRGSFIRGFQLRSQEDQRSKDDTAANNIRVICDRVVDIVEGEGGLFGDWTVRQECLGGHVVCGFRTQVEFRNSTHGNGDYSGLNNVDMKCCEKSGSLKSSQNSAVPRLANAIDPAILTELLDLAKEYSAPFTPTALKRLHGGVFGSDRGSRSTDVAIYNTLDLNFTYTGGRCDGQGHWSKTLSPENEIPPKMSVVYGAQNRFWLTGATDCKVNYRSSNGTYFEIITSNPYMFDNTVILSSSPTIRVRTIRNYSGDHSIIKVFVLPREEGSTI